MWASHRVMGVVGVNYALVIRLITFDFLADLGQVNPNGSLGESCVTQTILFTVVFFPYHMEECLSFSQKTCIDRSVPDSLNFVSPPVCQQGGAVLPCPMRCALSGTVTAQLS